jgi:SAM-dependent methyltransferase
MNIQEAYDHLAAKTGLESDLLPYLAEITLEQSVLNPILPDTVRKLGRLLELKPGLDMLDLACGKGGMSLPLVHTYQVKLTGVDLMPDYIREAWSRAEYTGLHHLCRFKLMDALAFVEQTEKQWDRVMIIGALPFLWTDLEKGVVKLMDLVKPGGYLVIGEAYTRPGGEKHPVYHFPDQEETSAIIGRHGRIVEILDDGDPGWDAMIMPMKKAIARLKAGQPNHERMIAFLDDWSQQIDWDKKNLGFGVWVIKKD